MTKIDKIETGHMENGELVIDGVKCWELSLGGNLVGRFDTEEDAKVEAAWLENDDYRMGV